MYALRVWDCADLEMLALWMNYISAESELCSCLDGWEREA